MLTLLRRGRYYFRYNVYRKLKRKYSHKPPLKGVHVYSYPKSGRTWLRLMLDQLNDTGLSMAYVHGDAVPGKLRHYKTMTFDLEKFRDRKVIFLFRDPRDTVVSAYYDAVNRDRIFDGSISKFIRHHKFGIKKVIAFHQLCFEHFPLLSDYIAVKYEDLQADTKKELIKVLNHLGAHPSDDELQKTISFASFSNMKKMELGEEFTGKYAYSLSLVDKDNPNSGKVRKGKVGGYLDELSVEDVYYCNEIMETEKNPFYPV